MEGGSAMGDGQRWRRVRAAQRTVGGGVPGERQRSGDRRGYQWVEDRMGMMVLTSSAARRILMAGGEERDVVAAWAHGGAALRRCSGDEGVSTA